jgi:hypothetical protein
MFYLSMSLTKDRQTLVRVSECQNQRGKIQKDGQLNLQEAKRVDMASQDKIEKLACNHYNADVWNTWVKKIVEGE